MLLLYVTLSSRNFCRSQYRTSTGTAQQPVTITITAMAEMMVHVLAAWHLLGQTKATASGGLPQSENTVSVSPSITSNLVRTWSFLSYTRQYVFDDVVCRTISRLLSVPTAVPSSFTIVSGRRCGTSRKPKRNPSTVSDECTRRCEWRPVGRIPSNGRRGYRYDDAWDCAN